MKVLIVMCPVIILLISSSVFILTSSSPSPSPSPSQQQQHYYLSHDHDYECNALLAFSASFTIAGGVCGSDSRPKTRSWKNGTDCCSWEGVTCTSTNTTHRAGATSGNTSSIHNHVVVSQLDLSCSCLLGVLPSKGTFFSLHNLERLNLAGNDFWISRIPPQFGAFKRMTHLNLSHSNLAGSIPSEIFHLSNLISLDLSWGNPIHSLFVDHSFERLVQNLPELRQLVLNDVYMPEVSPNFVRNLSSTLTSLQCSDCGLQGILPNDIFHLPNLQELDLSYNQDLRVSLPQSNNWTSSSSLVYLNLIATDFNGEFSSSIGGLNNLEELRLSDVTTSMLDSFWNLRKITSLDLGWSSSSEQHVNLEIFVEKFQNLRRLSLSNANVVYDHHDSGNVNLSKLEVLELQECNLSKFPSVLSSLQRLKVLDLSDNMIDEEIPNWFWSTRMMHTLERLFLSENKIRGVIPPSLFQWDKLEEISLSYNQLQGQLPDLPPSVVRFYASYNHFTGNIPSSICQLTSLMWLDLSDNHLSGGDNILTCLGNLSNVRSLSLDGSQLEGNIPSSICRMTSLIFLSLQNNNLTATIPTCLGNLTDLQILSLGRNHFTGNIPSSICQLTVLMHLNLSNNSLTGHIPPCLGNLRSLQSLLLYHNHFTGNVPSSICQLTFLIYLGLSNNSLIGHIPPCLGNLSGLLSLDLDHNHFTGNVPSSICQPTLLRDLYLSDNSLTGHIPPCLGNTSSLQSLDLGDNHFEGLLPVPPPTLQYYILSNNNFTGPIPSWICNATGLIIINLSNNSLSRPIPHCFTNFNASLSVLNLRGNKLGGQIPSAIFVPGNRLRTVDFSQNQFGGMLPRSLALCKDLEVLDLANNMIVDSFPSRLETLPKLQVLVLRANRFYGHVIKSSNTSLPFPKLHIFDISRNNFSGPLPNEYIRKLRAMMDENKTLDFLHFQDGSLYQDSITVTMKGLELKLEKILQVFDAIDLSENSFQGVISEDIGDLKAVKGLNFSHNNLTGSIPYSIGNLKSLEWLDLSSNKLTGEIPNTMVELTFLAVLNLSMNQLTGPIPQGRQFDTFRSNSFDGNPGLCGTQLSKPCRSNGAKEPAPASNEERDSEQEKWIEWRAVAMGYGSGLVIGVSVGYILLETRRPFWLAKMVEKKIYSRRTRTRARRNVPRQHGRSNRAKARI